jgi:osmotically-inducible protein OsmY
MKTDSQLQLDVLAELKWEPSVTTSRIGVEVQDGIVTLAGEVHSFAEKWHAERATLRVAGVRALAIDLTVKLSGQGKRTDSDIARSVQSALEWSTPLPADAIKALVEDGWVTLNGQVEWQYQKEAAALAVRYLTGVTGVSNQIALKSKVSTAAVKAEIDAALQRRAFDNSPLITVTVDGNQVTLTGEVHSWAERELARDAAWGTAGVHRVDDRMTLSA